MSNPQSYSPTSPTTAQAPTWVVVGSALSAPRWIDAALHLADHTITTNSGWQFFLTAEPPRVPDYFWLNDSVAIGLHARAARWMQRRGTRIVVSHAAAPGLGIDLPDRALERIDIGKRDPRPSTTWSAGGYINGRTSGAICVQYAVNQLVGRGQVLIVGMDGYQSTPTKVIRDTFDGRMGKISGTKIAQEWQAPLLQAIVNARPDVDFVWCGIPSYPIVGKNVQILTEVHELKEKAMKVIVEFVRNVNGKMIGDQVEVSPKAARMLVGAGVAKLLTSPTQQEPGPDAEPITQEEKQSDEHKGLHSEPGLVAD